MSLEKTHDEDIRELKDENSRLLKLLAEKNFEIKNILKKLEAEKCLSQVVAGGDAASSKIVELSKKLREQNSEIEIEKSKVKQLQKKCFDLQKQCNSEKIKMSGLYDNMEKSDQDSKTGELKAIQEKLKNSESKVYEYRNHMQSLKAEIKVLQKVISQEVGENVSVQTLINSPGTWKGRHQQIVSLQKKIIDLKKQINDISDGRTGLRQQIEESESSHSNISSTGSKELFKIRQIEKNKKDSLEKLTNDLKNLEEELTSQKQKYEAVKARNQTLLNENKAIKQQAKILLEKEKHDNELIEALMKKQALLKEALVDETRQKKIENSASDQTVDTEEVHELKVLIGEQKEKIIILENQLKESKIKSKEISVSIDPLNGESTECTCQSSHRTPKEETKKFAITEALYLEAISERDTLIQQTETLEKRSQDLVIQLTETQCALQVQTRKAITLEKKFGKFKLEQGNKTNSTPASSDQQNLEDLLLKLEIQRDENNALKVGLQSTLKSKEEDIKVYMGMLEHAKRIFSESMKKFRDC